VGGRMPQMHDFIISRVRNKILCLLCDDPQQMYYVRELTRASGEEINAVRRELEHLDKAGIVVKEHRGNRIYYQANPTYDYFEDILSIVSKSTGIGLSLRENRKDLGKIKFACVSGKYAHNKPRDKGDVDLLIVGTVNLNLVNELIKKEEARRHTEINYTVMTQEEFMFRKSRRDPFLLGVLSRSRIMIIGDEDGLVDKTGPEVE
jgi:DNA-binding transcriptional ArsR family regulator